MNVPTVVPSLREGDDNLFARRVDARRVRLGDGESRHARAVRQVPRAAVLTPEGVTDETLAVLLEVRVEGQPVDRLDLLRPGEPLNGLDFLAQVEKQVRRGVRPV